MARWDRIVLRCSVSIFLFDSDRLFASSLNPEWIRAVNKLEPTEL